LLERDIVNLSIVIPLYNEQGSVEPLCDAIVRAVAPMEGTFEVLLVDDGSTDGTFERAREVAGRDGRFKVIRLKKNFGQTAGLHAGFDRAAGDTIVTMDGDLQNAPADIGRLVRKIEDGYDVVAGYREQRTESFLTRELPSQVANWLIRKTTGTPIIDNGCALRAYRADVIKRFPLYSEMHRLLPTILALAGVRIAQLQVKHRPRQYGESKYGLARVYKVLIDLLALKTVLTAARHPLFGFGKISAVSAGLCGVSLLTGVNHLLAHPEETIVVFLGAGMLWGALSFALLMFGGIAAMLYSRGDLQVDDLLEVKVSAHSHRDRRSR
jgi:glycosyltransferase involved in cell wall biosynthesis